MTDKKKTLETLLENTRRELFENTVHNDQPKFDPVLMSVTGKFLAQQIASELAEVQPMSYVPLKTGENYNKARAEFWVSPSYDPTMPWNDMKERNRQINEWCEEVYGPKGDWHDTACRWHASNRKYIFHNEEDRTMFILRWS